MWVEAVAFGDTGDNVAAFTDVRNFGIERLNQSAWKGNWELGDSILGIGIQLFVQEAGALNG